MKSLITLTVLWGCLLSLNQAVSATDTATRLLREVFSNYESFFRPGEGRPNSTVHVDFGASLVRIRSLNEAEETLDAIFYFRMTWKDPRLSWSPLDFDGIEVLRIPPSFIWRPDLMIYNGFQDTQGVINLFADVNVLVHSDGTVTYVPPIATKTPCAIDKTSDLQVCMLKIGSWTYDGYSVDLDLRSDEVELSSYVANSKWSLEKADIVRHVTRYPCCEEQYIDATITLTLRRNN